MNIRRLIQLAAATIIIGVIGYYLATTLIKNWHFVRQAQITADYRWILLAYLPLSISFYIGVSTWRYILKTLGVNLSWIRCFWTISGSHLAKFVPGHILALGGRIWLCSREGVSKSKSATGVVLEMITQLATSTIVFALYGLSQHKNIDSLYLWASLLFVSLLLLSAYPPVLRKVWHFIPRYGNVAEGNIDYSYKKIICIIMIYSVAWCLQGLGVWILARSIFPAIHPSSILSTIGAYGGAYALGFISIVTPGGLGVREGALSYLLSKVMPLPIAIIVAIGSRIWLTTFDIVMSAIAIKYRQPGA